jgi:hypothetical protein
LGKGGMGTVYRAVDLETRQRVALKENRDLTPEARRLFQREAALLRRLRHPNLPQVSDAFDIPGQGQYLVMDYIAGVDLSQLVAQRGALPEDEALAYMRQVMRALAYLHGQKRRPIIHRDVKPANIKITPQRQVYLVDFGLAKEYRPGAPTTTTARRATHGYAPPEQYGHGRTDARSDVYSVGATLYTLLTGQIPPHSVDRMLRSTVLVPPSSIQASISPRTERAILWAMQIQPRERPQSVRDLYPVLMDVAAGPQPSPPASPRPGTAIAATGSSWPSGRAWLVGLSLIAGGLLLALLALGTWLLAGDLRPEPTATLPAIIVRVTGTATLRRQPVATSAISLQQAPALAGPTVAALPATPRPTRRPQPEASATSRPAPTRTPQPQATQEPPPPAPTELPAPFPAPVLLKPESGETIFATYRFVWQYDGPPLGPGHAFDLRIWSRREDELGLERRGVAPPTRDTQLEVGLDYVQTMQHHGSGDYYWSVIVVTTTDPPQIAGEWAPKQRFVYREPTPVPTPKRGTPRP